MPLKKFIVASFDDEAVLFPAVKAVRKNGYKIHDVYTPMPIHGLDAAIGMRDTSLHTAGFFYGLAGTCTALGFISWALAYDWPLNFGGKPFLLLILFDNSVDAVTSPILGDFSPPPDKAQLPAGGPNDRAVRQFGITGDDGRLVFRSMAHIYDNRNVALLNVRVVFGPHLNLLLIEAISLEQVMECAFRSC